MRNTGVYRFNQQVVWWLFQFECNFSTDDFPIPIAWLFNGKSL